MLHFKDAPNTVRYRLVSSEHVSTIQADGLELLRVSPNALTLLAEEAMREVSFKLRPAHLSQLAEVAQAANASPNDRFVAHTLLRNACIAAKGQLPMCQDTGTATVVAIKGERVLTNADDHAALTEGIRRAYVNNNLRYSQVIPLSMCEECNSGNNLPAQIDIHSSQGDAYEFLFMAKGGGSANKTALFQETKALLSPTRLKTFLADKIRALGTSACPPYHIAIVVGGTSAEDTLKTVKLASAKALDGLPTQAQPNGEPFRDTELEQHLLQSTRNMSYGAQFGGAYFALDVRVIRLPRHGASCPVGLAVSCVADRNIRARIDRQGIWLEELEANPAQHLPPIDSPPPCVGQPEPTHTTGAGTTEQPPRWHTPISKRHHCGGTRHGSRTAKSRPRRWPTPPRLLQTASHLLRWSGQNTCRHGIRLVWTHHSRTHGCISARISTTWSLSNNHCQRQPQPTSNPKLQATRRILPWQHRRCSCHIGSRQHKTR